MNKTETKELTPEQATALSHFRNIYDQFAYDDRCSELSGDDEKVIEKIYNQWRGLAINIRSCDECVNEAFDRVMKELIRYEKAKTEAGQN